jgi:hypothetical protein
MRNTGKLFERFTDRARRVVVLAQEEARRLNHDHVGTEHILLGLIDEGEGVAAQALESLGISLESARQQVEEIIGRGQQAPSRHIPFTPRAKKVLELTLREAMQLGHNYVGTEHILLGLIREGEGVAAQVLVNLGGDLSTVRQQVIQLLQGYQDRDQPRSARLMRQRAPGRRQRGLMPEILAQVESIDSQLSAIGGRVGTGPETADLDRQIAQARRSKEAAAGEEEYERAAALRERERHLLADKVARQREWAAAHPDLASLAEELHRLNEEVGQLRGLLGQQGIDPHHGAA